MSVQVLRPLTINTAPAPADFRYAPADFQPFAQQDLQNQPPPVDAFFGPGATAAMQYPYAQAMMEHAPQHHQRPAMTSTSSSHSGCGDEHFDAFQQGSFGGYEQAAKPAHFFASLSPSAPPHHSSKPIAIGQAPRSVSAGDVTSRRRLSPGESPHDPVVCIHTLIIVSLPLSLSPIQHVTTRVLFRSSFHQQQGFRLQRLGPQRR